MENFVVDFWSQIYLDNDDRSQIYLVGKGGRLPGDISVGNEKSPISLFSTIPAMGDKLPPPNG
jgi:hypothetical protein